MAALAVAPSYRILNENQAKRRTIADAFEVLRSQPEFSETIRAEVRIGALLLPWNEKTGVVLLVSPQMGCAVTLPSADYFKGIRSAGHVRDTFKIGLLDSAIVDSECNVQLADGAYLRAVEIVPRALPFDQTSRERRIVALTLQFMGIEDQCCYGRLLTGEDGRVPLEMIEKFLDYSKLADLELPKLEAIRQYIIETDPTLREISRQTITNALRRAGMWRSMPRRRSQAAYISP